MGKDEAMYRESRFATGIDPDSGVPVFKEAKRLCANLYGDIVRSEDLFADFTVREEDGSYEIERTDVDRKQYLENYKGRFKRVFPLLDVCDRSFEILRALDPTLSFNAIAAILDKEMVYRISPQSLQQRIKGRKGESLSIEDRVAIIEKYISPEEMKRLTEATEEYKNQVISDLINRKKAEYLAD